MQPTNLNEIIKAAESMLASGLGEPMVATFLQQQKVKLKIVNGRIIDETDAAEIYLEKFITQNKQMLELKEDVRKLANENYPVLIVGPTGTGKELIARALQGRRGGRFMAINCAGLPEQLIESELFGHKRGAFTDSREDKMGIFEAAEKDGLPGVVFLDEVSELPMQAQGKLLRAIQTMRIRRVGENDEREISCRFVCASNVSIAQRVSEHKFRMDLYARIGTFELHTNALYHRFEDIVLLYERLGAASGLLDWLKSYFKSQEESYRNLIYRKDDLEQLYPFNVRSIQAHINRYKVLGKLPI